MNNQVRRFSESKVDKVEVQPSHHTELDSLESSFLTGVLKSCSSNQTRDAFFLIPNAAPRSLFFFGARLNVGGGIVAAAVSAPVIEARSA